MNFEFLIIIIGLAILDTLSPTTIGITLYLLLTEKKQLYRRLVLYLFTVVILYFLLGSALLLGISLSLDYLKNLFKLQFVSWTVFLVGVILFLLSFNMPKKKSFIPPLSDKNTSNSMIFLGIITFLIEGGTALPYFAAIGLMSNSNLTFPKGIFILGLYNLIMILPSILLIVLYKLLGQRIQHPLQKLSNKLANRNDSALSWVVCIVGLVLIFVSLDYL